jgi:diguanylate cyclase (GGDEF)-like protein
MEGISPSDLQASLVSQLLLEQGSLVLADRVTGPREVVQRLEPIIRKALGADVTAFLPVDSPPGEFWSSGRTTPTAIPAEEIRDLARTRSNVLYARDLSRLKAPRPGAPHSGSALYIGIGDEIGGWRGVLEIRDRRTQSFDSERIGLAVLLATHFQTLLASTVRLQSLIFFDFLTGLYNRPYFEDQLEKQLTMAQRRGQSLALCIIDIDDFKSFNTRFGYEGGDRVLVTVGCVLKAALRASDTLARYGGEEFAALLAPPVTPEEAQAIAERLRSAVEAEPFQVQSLGGEVVSEKITVSIGGALFPLHGQAVREIWTSANRMLLDAKHSGKNRTRFAGDTHPAEGTKED